MSKRFLFHAITAVGFLALGLAAGRKSEPVVSAANSVPVPVEADSVGMLFVTELPSEECGRPRTLRIHPHRIEENGTATNFDVDRGSRHWIVSLDGGRVRVFGTSD
jgi:hypothetical protein